MKCSQCRQNDRELLTTWERVREWLFRRFTTDIEELSSAKYTQGFSDGYVRGFDIAITSQAVSPEELESQITHTQIEELEKYAQEN